MFNSRNYELISTEYVSAKSKLEYYCNRHKDKGILSITYSNIKNGCGCPYCGRERQTEKRRGTFEHAKEIFARHDMELQDQEYINSKIPMKYICIHHRNYGIQYMTLTNAYKQHCPLCHKSKGEFKIEEYLKSNNIKYIPQFKIKDNNISDNRFLLSYDFYLPDHNVFIEFQGRQHEEPVSIFGGEESFARQLQRDERKRKYAATNNIELIEIWHSDYNKIDEILYRELNKIKSA